MAQVVNSSAPTPESCLAELDMGRSCLRFRRAADLDAIRAEIASATPAEFIALYAAARVRYSSS